MATFTLEEATIADVGAAFDAGALSCEALVQRYLDRIAAYDDAGPRLNSIITVNPRAIDAARRLDEERAATGRRGPLHCVPVLLKDNVDTADMPTTNGSVILRDATPPDDAYVTRALRDAGALILGKASLGEFAGGNSYNSVDGQTLNPYNLRRGAGGSSSGSAVAVAANLAVAAVGTDTSTSVRNPAAFSGIVGLRPTTGLVSRDGIAPKNLTFDTAGPMARTVTDAAILLSAMAGPDPADPDGLSAEVFAAHPAGPEAARLDYTRFLERGSLRGARLGVARDYFGGDPEVDALAEAAIAAMRGLGAEIVDPVTFDGSFVDGVRVIADYRFREDWEAYLRTFGPGVPGTVARFIEIYETEVARSALPAEASVLDLLGRASRTSTDHPDHVDLVENVLPRNTRLKLAVFDAHDLDALVFPVPPRLRSARSRPDRHRGRSDVRADGRRAEPRDAGRVQLGGLPRHRRPDGVRLGGVADGRRVPGPALRRGEAHRLRLRLRTGHDDAASVAAGPAPAGRDHRVLTCSTARRSRP